MAWGRGPAGTLLRQVIVSYMNVLEQDNEQSDDAVGKRFWYAGHSLRH